MTVRSRRPGLAVLAFSVHLLVGMTLSPAGAAPVLVQDANGVHPTTTGTDASSVQYQVTLNPAVPANIDPTPADLAAMTTEFPFPWVFLVGEPLVGSLTVRGYDAGINLDGTAGTGHDFVVDFDSHVHVPRFPESLQARLCPAGEDPKTADLNFIGVVYTNAPAPGHTSPYLDNEQGDPSLPFFYAPAEVQPGSGLFACNVDSNGWVRLHLRFEDVPTRALSLAPVTWHLNVFLVEWDRQSPGEVIVHDGFVFGFNINCVGNGATAGDANDGGVYSDRNPPGQAAVATAAAPICPPLGGPSVPAASTGMTVGLISGMLLLGSVAITRHRRTTPTP